MPANHTPPRAPSAEEMAEAKAIVTRLLNRPPADPALVLDERERIALALDAAHRAGLLAGLALASEIVKRECVLDVEADPASDYERAMDEVGSRIVTLLEAEGTA